MTLCIPNGIMTVYHTKLKNGGKGETGAVDNREKIMQCALDLFYAKGYDAVGVQEIADRAGITKPTLYYYFGSKCGLLETLLAAQFGEVRIKLKEASAYEGDIGQVLYNISSFFLDFAATHYKFYMLFMALFYSAKENEAYKAVSPFVSEFYQFIVQVFDRASHELGNMNGRQEQFAIGFIGLINHYILWAHENEEGKWTVPEEKKRALLQQFMYGIFS